MEKLSDWVTCLIDVSADNQTSTEADLGGYFDSLVIEIPTITSAQINVKVSRTSGGTFYDLYSTDADGTSAKIISDAGTGGLTWIVPLGGFRYIKLYSSASQGADRTFYLRGINQFKYYGS